MTDIRSRAPRRRPGYAWLAVGPVAVAGAIAVFIASQPAVAATAPVGLGTASSFAVLAGTTVTNTGPSKISGNLGVSPGTAVTGFPPGIVSNGTIHSADGVAAGAQSDLTTAYNDAAGRSPTANVPGFIGAGQTLDPGVYKASSSLDVGGSLTLDAHGDPDAVFIFQAPSTLVTDSASSIRLTGDAQACNVFWQVGSSATLGTGSDFAGSILALTSITVTTGDTVAGRALARNGAVTLDDDTFTTPTCATTPPPPPTPTATATATGPTPTPSPSPSTTPRPAPSPAPVNTSFPVTG
jgi:Ice-binding-like